MTTIELASLFADAECPDCVLADALIDSGVELPRGVTVADVRFFYDRLNWRDRGQSHLDTIGKILTSANVADAENWGEREGIEYRWEDDDGAESEGRPGRLICYADHPEMIGEDDTPFIGDVPIGKFGEVDGHDQRVIEAQLAEMVRDALPDPHPLTDCCPYNLAKEYGLFYSGDVSPIPHGGYWYSLAEWEEWGYAAFVEVEDWGNVREDEILVTFGTVNRPDDMTGAIASMGLSNDELDIPACQIEACKDYGYVDRNTEKTFRTTSRRSMNAMWAFIAEELAIIRTNKKGN